MFMTWVYIASLVYIFCIYFNSVQFLIIQHTRTPVSLHLFFHI